MSLYRRDTFIVVYMDPISLYFVEFIMRICSDTLIDNRGIIFTRN